MYFIRKEKKSDYREVERMIALTTKEQGNSKLHYQICCLRGNKEFHKELTFVAEDKGDIIGFITIFNVYIDHHDQTDFLYLLSPVVNKQYANQGVAYLLIKNALDEAKFMGYKSVLIEKNDTLDQSFSYKLRKDLAIVDGINKQHLNIFMVQFDEQSSEDIAGELRLPSVFYDYDEALFKLYDSKLFQSQASAQKNKRFITKGAFVLSLLFVIAAVVLTVLRVKNIVSPAVGLGSIVIAIGGCLGSIGISNFVTDKKIMGWVAVFLAAIVIVLGVFVIINP